MKLYYFQGSCALAPHITLEWAGADYTLEEVKRSDTRKEDFLKNVNPFGKVPVLELDDGRKIHQVNALQNWLARNFADAELGADDDDADYQMQNLMSYFNGDVHPAFTPFFLTFRYTDNEDHQPGIKDAAARELDFHLTNLDTHMVGRDWVIGNRRSILDPYLFVFCNWARFLSKSIDEYPNLNTFAGRMMADDGVQAAMKAQGLIK